jgi:hypothetical protein
LVNLLFCAVPTMVLLRFPSRIPGEKEQLIREHREALDA